MKLGIVTYEIAQDWDFDTIINICSELGYEGVELRTTHAHNVEVSLSQEKRKEVRRKVEDSTLKLVGLGSAFEYHSPDEEELNKNIVGTKEYIKLAADVGAEGVKVRPNAFPERIPKEKTIEQIGFSLREVSSFADDYGIKIRLEVHGLETSHPPYIKKMLDIANHDNLYVCWNCNMPNDLDESGSIKSNFNLLKERIGLVHITELCNKYPWRELFSLLKGINYDGFCLAEIPKSSEPERLLRYYHALFKSYSE